jgi:hypothetical protein
MPRRQNRPAPINILWASAASIGALHKDSGGMARDTEASETRVRGRDIFPSTFGDIMNT